MYSEAKGNANSILESILGGADVERGIEPPDMLDEYGEDIFIG